MKVKFEMEISNEEGMELFKAMCQVKGVAMVALKDEKEPTVNYPTEPCMMHTPEAPLSTVANYHIGVDLASTPDHTVIKKIPVTETVAVPTETPRVVQPLPVVTNYVAPYATAQPNPNPSTAPIAPAPLSETVAPASTTENFSLEQLAFAASTGLVDAGRRNELIDLLGLFGIQTMGQLPVESYGLFATHLRSKGVKI